MTETERLREMLDEAGIPWVDATDDFMVPSGVQVIERTQSVGWMKPKEPGWSVICGLGTYGGAEGLLELWFGKESDEPMGWLTAEAAIRMIRKEVG